MHNSEEIKKILVVSTDDELTDRVRKLKLEFPLEVVVRQGSYETLQALRRQRTNLVLLDYEIPLMSGKEMIELVHKSYPDIPVIVLINELTTEEKKAIIEAGAFDYLSHPVDFDELKEKITNVLFSEEFHYHVAELRKKIKKTFGLENIIGDCEAMWKVFHSIKNISISDVTVFINGESGTGKELLARAIHRSSPRRNESLVVINCAAIPENLLESELFGHEKGSFSGAISQRIGKFELADKGSFFLDEIGEMSIHTQSKILRLLEEQEFERVGGNKTIKVDVRIITATNKNLEKEIETGNFRKDLFYRINVYPIVLPPLRERADDIPLLIFYFMDVLSKKNTKEVLSITPDALDLLKEYPWPGNIRELENILERAILNCPGKVLTVDEFSHLEVNIHTPDNEFMGKGTKQSSPRLKADNNFDKDEHHVLSLKQIEKRAILYALNRNEGNISSTARQLDIGRATLYRKIKEYEIRSGNTYNN